MVPVDLAGRRFGKLVAIEPTSERKRGAVVWRCRCDCGNEILIESRCLKPGVILSCGCDKTEYANIKDLTGLRFGKLVVLQKSERRAKDRNPLWICQCECGNTIETTKRKLFSGNVSSCGCGRKPPLKDWVGKRFGMLEVIEYVGKENGCHLWRCRCDCGKIVEVRQSNLQDGVTTSCGCKLRERSGLHFVDGTFVEAIQSKTISQANTSGVRGVYFNKKQRKWVAQIMFKGKCYYLGSYSKIEDAAKARARGEEMFDDFLDWYHQEYDETKKKEPV